MVTSRHAGVSTVIMPNAGRARLGPGSGRAGAGREPGSTGGYGGLQARLWKPATRSSAVRPVSVPPSSTPRTVKPGPLSGLASYSTSRSP
jgi:hypothetical protein